MSHKSEMAGPFNRGDTIINKHFYLFGHRTKGFLSKICNMINILFKVLGKITKLILLLVLGQEKQRCHITFTSSRSALFIRMKKIFKARNM